MEEERLPRRASAKSFSGEKAGGDVDTSLA